MTQKNLKSKFALGIGIALFSTIFGLMGTLIANYIDISIGYERNIKQLKAERQNAEIDRGRVEVENFLKNYGNFITQVNVIFKNLTRVPIISTEDFYSSELNRNNFYLNEKDLKKRVLDLASIVPALNNNYFDLTIIQKIPIPEDVIGSINGTYFILAYWSQYSKELPFTINRFNVPVPHWYPQNNLTIPPKDPLKVEDECMNKLYGQIKTLVDIRKRVIDGDFE